MAGYTRQSSLSDGDIISASLFNNEYNQLLAAFNNSTGHKHDGTASEGPVIALIGDAGLQTPLNKVTIDTSNNEIEFSIDVSSVSTEQFKIIDGAIVPTTDNDIDLGTSSLEFKDAYFDGTVNLDALVIGSATAIIDVDTDLTSVSASDDTLASAKAIKTYVDAQVTVQDLDFIGDTGGAQSIDLDSQTLTIAGGTGISSVGSAQTITLNIDSTVATLTGSQTLTNKTLTTPTISSILNTGTLTLPTSTDTLVGKATTDTLTNKTIDANGTGNSITNLEVADLASGVLDTDLTSVAATDTTLASAKAIKTYVDAQVATANELAELTDVNITSPADASLLFYDTATSKWIDNVVSGDITIADTGIAAISSGVIVNADINASAAIDATKIHDGSISNTEFGYLNGVTSNIQTQLTSLDTLKAPLASPTFTGTVSAPTPTAGDSSTKVATTAFVTNAVALENELSEMNDVAITSVADADFLVYDSTSTKWENQSISGDVSITNTGVASINSGVIVNADINASAAIDATKIHDGSVTNTEFGYIGGLTSDAQTQLNAKLENVVDDTTPQLGGNLDLNSNDITGTGDINITGTITATTISGTIGDVVDDTTPQLGGDLDLNSSDVTGTGNVNITGTITSTGDITTSGVLNSIAPTRHSIRPSLNLDFANSKVLDPRITFTRGSNATYYDGYTSVKAEENLIKYSQEFDNSSWGKGGLSITANNTTAPDGTTTAELITADTNTVVHYLSLQSSSFYSVVNNKYYTFSVFVKAGTASVIQLVMSNATPFGFNSYANFDLSTGTVSFTGSALTDSSITDVGNSWYRISISAVSVNTATDGNFILCFTNPSSPTTRLANFTTAGTETFYAWGAQVEQRDSLTAYTPTTSSPITKYQPALQTAGNNVARFDHNPTTGESLGLLIEESRTNLLTYSEDFSNANWVSDTGQIEQNIIIAPDGTLTGAKLYENTIVDDHKIDQSSITVTSGTTYSASVYAKKAENNWLVLFVRNPNTVAYFNLEEGTVSGASTSASTEIIDVGNGWYRCSMLYTSDASSTTFSLYTQNTFSTGDYQGDGYSGIYIWGAQLEQGSFPTSYIKTTGSQVTRSFENVDMNNIDTSDWFRQGEGTLFLKGLKYKEDASWFIGLHDGTLDSRISIANNPSSTGSRYIVKNNNITSIDSYPNQSVSEGDYLNTIISYKRDNFSATANGLSNVTDTSGTVPIVDTLTIGRRWDLGIQRLNSTIKKVSYYPKALTSNEIQDLTEE